MKHKTYKKVEKAVLRYICGTVTIVTINRKILWTVLFQKETAIEKEKKERRGKIQEAGKTEGKKRKKLMHSNVMVSE